MKKIFLLLFVSALCVSVAGARPRGKVAKRHHHSAVHNPTYGVHDADATDSPDVMPQFPGGQEALMKFISSHLNYPEKLQRKNISGRAMVQFIVEKDGRVANTRIAKSTGNRELDYEAALVAMRLPRFKPGLINGKPVRVLYTLPVNFALE